MPIRVSCNVDHHVINLQSCCSLMPITGHFQREQCVTTPTNVVFSEPHVSGLLSCSTCLLISLSSILADII